jgi:hypothetical protein
LLIAVIEWISSVVLSARTRNVLNDEIGVYPVGDPAPPPPPPPPTGSRATAYLPPVIL